MNKINVFILYILIFLTSSSCDGDDTIVGNDPTNLVIEIMVSDDRSGTVNVTASAGNTIEYTFLSGDSNNDPVVNTNGVFEYTYAITGIYTIEVRAYNEAGKFLRKEQQINIIVGDDELPVNTDEGYITPLTYEGMNLIWQDEFNGSALNEADWNYEIGTGSSGWGNNELQYYRKENTSVVDGYLVIEAKKENFGSRSYTSSRLTTQNKFDFKYGRVDIRATLPEGQGIWPALWMLGANFSSVGWPRCGEIDIMEMIGGSGRENDVFGTLHWDNAGEFACTCGQGHYILSSGTFADEFHVFTLVWDESSIKWYVNDNLYHTINTSPADLEEFRENFFFIFNIAVGGNLPGSPDASTVFPQRMIVDYIRVFQN